jgi:hypothetical protein
MSVLNQAANYTLHVETREDETGLWLCVDDGATSIPIAKFISEEAVELYHRATHAAFVKAHTMGRMGI